MIRMTRQCMGRGLYAEPSNPTTTVCWRDWRYRICRHMFKIFNDGSYDDTFGWSRWVHAHMGLDNNFSPVEKSA